MTKKSTTMLVITAFMLGYGARETVSNFSIQDPSHLQASMCFTPGMPCTQMIIDELNQAKHDIRVQAYSFTSKSIAEALVKAKRRGVDVQVILDKSQVNYKYSVYPQLAQASIPIFVDSKPAIAHNKIIMIDGVTTLTGSFNFTQAEEKRNAENILVLHQPEVTTAYLNNWNHRLMLSTDYSLYAKNLQNKSKKAA